MDGIATAAANERAKAAATQLRRAGGHSNWVFELQMALGDILHFADPRRERYELPDSRPTRDLLAGVYRALGNTIEWGTSDPRLGKIEAEHLTEGLLAAARLVEAIDKENTSADRYVDDRTRVKILIHSARIAEHRQDMANRQRDRERGTIDQIFGKAAGEAELFA
ncbi:MAG: hypothetical protein DI537_33195 [Stutzerimonas stutzeri]|nr:MAG: hypothetical protein DI537_33195 [Stutzerimonas stutzeri]